LLEPSSTPLSAKYGQAGNHSPSVSCELKHVDNSDSNFFFSV